MEVWAGPSRGAPSAWPRGHRPRVGVFTTLDACLAAPCRVLGRFRDAGASEGIWPSGDFSASGPSPSPAAGTGTRPPASGHRVGSPARSPHPELSGGRPGSPRGGKLSCSEGPPGSRGPKGCRSSVPAAGTEAKGLCPCGSQCDTDLSSVRKCLLTPPFS